MSATISIIDVNGIKALTQTGVQQPLSRAVTLISAFMRDQAKKNVKEQIYNRQVPWKRTGRLQQSIQTNKISDLSSEVVASAPYASFVEYGTAPHLIMPKNGNFLVFQAGGQTVFARSVNHPGTKPYPFFNPAIQTTQENVSTIIWKEVDRIWSGRLSLGIQIGLNLINSL
jgi:HK97 gp10 family phage protein